MSQINHLNDRKRIYVEKLEKILDEIEWQEQEYESCDIPGNRDPGGKKDALEKIAMLERQFEETKNNLEKAGKPIYK